MERRVGEEDVDGKACAVVGVECGDDEGELDSRDGTGAGEEEMAFVISVGEGTEGCGGGDGIGGGGGHCCAAVWECGVVSRRQDRVVLFHFLFLATLRLIVSPSK